MVTKTIVSRFIGDLPLDEAGGRKIAAGPLYPVAEVQALLAGLGAQAVSAWTKKFLSDM